MSSIFIIHGAFGNPDENWIPWLKMELEVLGHQVIVPKFPTPKDQSLENWKHVFSAYEKFLDNESMVVGHSLGVTFLLRILETQTQPVHAAFFIAPVLHKLGRPEFDSINQSFVEKPFDWKSIQSKARKFYLFHSDNDSYVPVEEAEKLASHLDTPSKLVSNAGHFNEAAGFLKFELLLDSIKSEFRRSLKWPTTSFV